MSNSVERWMPANAAGAPSVPPLLTASPIRSVPSPCRLSRWKVVAMRAHFGAPPAAPNSAKRLVTTAPPGSPV